MILRNTAKAKTPAYFKKSPFLISFVALKCLMGCPQMIKTTI